MYAVLRRSTLWRYDRKLSGDSSGDKARMMDENAVYLNMIGLKLFLLRMAQWETLPLESLEPAAAKEVRKKVQESNPITNAIVGCINTGKLIDEGGSVINEMTLHSILRREADYREAIPREKLKEALSLSFGDKYRIDASGRIHGLGKPVEGAEHDNSQSAEPLLDTDTFDQFCLCMSSPREAILNLGTVALDIIPTGAGYGFKYRCSAQSIARQYDSWQQHRIRAPPHGITNRNVSMPFAVR